MLSADANYSWSNLREECRSNSTRPLIKHREQTPLQKAHNARMNEDYNQRWMCETGFSQSCVQQGNYKGIYDTRPITRELRNTLTWLSCGFEKPPSRDTVGRFLTDLEMVVDDVFDHLVEQAACRGLLDSTCRIDSTHVLPSSTTMKRRGTTTQLLKNTTTASLCNCFIRAEDSDCCGVHTTEANQY